MRTTDKEGVKRQIPGISSLPFTGPYPTFEAFAASKPDRACMDDSAAKAELVSLRTKFFYGLGSVAFGIKDNGFQTILLLFYNQVIGLPGPLVGLAIAIALLVDAFLDPIVGQISDNFHSRWGRRHPFMYASALPVAISYLLLWNPPHWSQHALFFYLLVVAIVVRTFITFYEIPSAALAPELSEDYDQRTSFIGFRLFFGWYGGLTMLFLAYAVFLQPDAAHKVGQLNAAGYSRYGITAAIIMFVSILISARGTHRFIPYFRNPPVRQVSMMQYTRETFASMANKAFLILMVSGIIFYFATGVVFALSIYINTYFWQLSAAQVSVLTLSSFVAVFFSFIIALPFSKWLGKKRASMWMFVVGILVVSAPLAFGLMGLFPPRGSSALVVLLFAFGVVGAGLAIGSSILLVSMLADVVEDSELKTGRRSEGLFFAGASFMQKCASGLGLLGSGLILSAAHFPAHAVPGHIAPEIVRHFALIYLPVTTILYLIAMAIIGLYPISRESHNENLRKLASEVAQAGEPVDMGVEP
jgi:GPH family glycoside/pentoside/hexuronide:cation symporter